MSINPRSMDWALFSARFFAALIFMIHGSQKMFGAFGGPGLQGTLEMMGPVGYLVAVAEFFGGLGLLVGFLARFSALALMGVMLGAIFMVHLNNGFFAGDNGVEFPLTLFGLLSVILFGGTGAFSLGRVLPLPRRSDGVRPALAVE